MEEEGRRVLVVDDEPGIREGCRRILSASGYQVTTAEDGESGYAAFKNGGFDVALVDLKMPRMGGVELTKRMHAMDEKLIILVITAYASIGTAVEVTKEGAYGYIPKPFTPNELLLPIRNGLERRDLALEAERLREERERSLLEVAWERSKCRGIIQCMKDGVLVVNRQGNVVLLNDSAARALSEEAVPSVPFPLNRLKPKELRKLIAGGVVAATGPLVLSREVRLGDATYMVNASAFDDTAGEKAGVVAVLTDVTELKKLETARSLFVTMVAHEVKSPLAAAEGYLKILLDGTLVEDEVKKTEMLERSVTRISSLRMMVSELMNITAIDTGNFTLQRIPRRIVEILEKAVASIGEKAEDGKIRIRLHCSPVANPDRVFIDEDATLIIFRNLLENAVKYTPEGGRVSVDLDRNGTFARIRVTDTGIGLAPGDCDRIFEEFYRVKNERTANVPGTGLGLTLVRKLLELQNGTISVQSRLGGGAQFTVLLPLSH